MTGARTEKVFGAWSCLCVCERVCASPMLPLQRGGLGVLSCVAWV
jgi:hypothetical protein